MINPHTCQRFLIFEDVLNQIVDKLNTGLFGWFIRCILFRLEKLEQVRQCLKKEVLNTDKTPHWVKTQHKIKYLHSEEAAQTSHSQCLDTLQPLEEIKHRLKIHKPNFIMRQKIYKEQVDKRLTL